MRWSPILRALFAVRSLRAPLLAMVAALTVPVAALALTGNGKLQIHHIDVGQGDGMLLVSPSGQTALFDDGNYLNCSGIKAYLQGLGVTSVDYHFCSHYHSDHLGCIDDLAAVNIVIGTAGWDRGYSYSSGTYTAYVTTLGARRRTLVKGQVVTLDSLAADPVRITCVDLNGAGVYSPTGADENSKSVVLKVTYGAFDEVIAGDLTGDPASGNDVETTVGPEVGDVEVYKVHHHGSRYSSNDNWLTAVTPEVGIIQVGNGNSYGHPTLDALTRLHNHGVKTYWTETGAGATPDPAWDKVANGAVVVEAVPTAGGTFTVTGNGFADNYTIGGGGGPVYSSDTRVASSVTMLQGTVTSGSVANLAANDASRTTVTSAKVGTTYRTDWYGSVVLAHPATSLTLTYDGNHSVSRTQTLHLWNWTTSAWVQVDQATVSTSDVTRSFTTTSPAVYVSPAGEVRVRVLANTRSSSYTCRADYLAIRYQYLQGTGITLPIADFRAWPAIEDRDRLYLPQSVLLRADAAADERGAVLTWSVLKTDHVDGFNVYREDGEGNRVHVGEEALIDLAGSEAVFRYVDPAGAALGGTYWLGARSCSGPEGLIGPFQVVPSSGATELALAVSPNPAPRAARLSFTLPRESAVRLSVFDLQGRRVATPFAGLAPAGPNAVEWSLRDESGQRVRPGLYFARFEGLGRTWVTRVIVTDR